VAWFSALEEAEEFRRRLRLSGINASVISKGKDGYEVVVPKDELEKLTPEEKEAVKQYLEHVAQTGDEEKKKGGGGGATPLPLRRQGSQHRRSQAWACL
jgi:predicted metal-dependent phosphoesterase TrpH